MKDIRAIMVGLLLVEFTSRMSLAAEHHDAMNSRSDELMFFALITVVGTLVTHVHLAENLLAVVQHDHARRDVAFAAIFHVHRVPLLVLVEGGCLGVGTPIVVEATHVASTTCVAYIVPDSSHDRLAVLVLECDILIGLLAR